MPTVLRRLLPTALVTLLVPATPALAGVAFVPVTPSAAARTPAPAPTVGARPSPLLDVRTVDGRPGDLTIERKPLKGRIVAGTRVDIRTVPWQVYLYTERGGYAYTCGGSIVNATTVITAAHCVTGVIAGQPYSASGLGVFSGLSDVVNDVPTDVMQGKTASAIRVHKGYVDGPTDLLPQGDVAVVTLSTPLDLSGPTAKPISLAPAAPASIDGEPVPVGPVVRVSGYGLQLGTAEDSDGLLYTLDMNVADPDECGYWPDAVGICATNAGGSICSGDSGGPLVSGGVLVGVVSAVADNCRPGAAGLFTNLLVPENRQFVDNALASPAVPPVPPVAPRGTSGITASSSSYQVGGTLSCSGATFSGAGLSVKYVISNDQGARLASSVGPSIAYTQTAGDVGRLLRCRAYGSNAAGVATSELLQAPVAIQPAPVVSTPIPAPAPKPVATPKPTPTPGAPGTPDAAAARALIEAVDVSVRAPKSVRRGRSFSVTVTYRNASPQLRELKAQFYKPIRGSYDVGAKARKVTTSYVPDSGVVKFDVRLRMPANAKPGKVYSVTVGVGLKAGTEISVIPHRVRIKATR